jgi:hypothetical protein
MGPFSAHIGLNRDINPNVRNGMLTLAFLDMLTFNLLEWAHLALYGMFGSWTVVLNYQFRKRRVDGSIRCNQEDHEAFQYLSTSETHLSRT